MTPLSGLFPFPFRLARLPAVMLTLLLSGLGSRAQSLYVYPAVSTASFRGLSAVSDNIVWISGSEGTVGRSLNGGRFFQWIRVPGYAKTDFRDIAAFSDSEAVIMGITEPAVILRTTNAGRTWAKVFQAEMKGAFFDAIDFSGDSGILVGDPVSLRPLLARTSDRGAHWTAVPAPFSLTDTAEAFFAASGSNILLKPNGDFVCVSGGARSFIYFSDGKKDSLPLLQGGNSTGANAIARDADHAGYYYIVGGDFKKDSLRSGNAVLARLSASPGDSTELMLPASFPAGYRSGVCYADENDMVACGSSGVDISADGGMHWQKISAKSFNVCGRSPSGKKVFLAGGKGAVGVIRFP